MKNFILLSAFFLCIIVSCDKGDNRQVISLNGEWQITKTDGNLPEAFNSVLSIPGLVDMASPSLDTLGTLYPDGWYWHKRQLQLEEIDFDKIELKIFKAKYHTKVYVNGKFAGENFYCFTPSYFDIKPFLLPAGQTNEIVIGVGCKAQLPKNIPDGNEFEKLKYIPGIYDNVEITLSNKPFIRNIQCVPDIKNEKLRVVAEIETDATGSLNLEYNVTEVESQISIASRKITPETTQENGFVKVDFEIDMKNAKLWSPETPFLYELKLSTKKDNKTVRFGMRSFRFDAEKKIALLNEKPYYMRGTNICIFRFFEDPEREVLPWDAQWPVTLHERFKDMHWNAMRYCIGFPPERWYEICDSLGFLLQDEFPIWGDRVPLTFNADDIAEEYRRWMRERWNHPSVVIWDAQNETVTQETGIAIEMVRPLDLSGRPFENGWSRPMADTDPSESHPYLYSRFKNTGKEPETGYRKDFFDTIRRPDNDALTHLPWKEKEAGVTFNNPSIINEYGWIWLNRDGSPTTLTENVYETLWKDKIQTPQQRLEIYARSLAELTEYWRAHRRATGVLHLGALSYSRPAEPRGQTSDNWVDIKNLTFEPAYYKYMKPAFSPVGLMIDAWEKSYKAGDKYQIQVFVINDLDGTFDQKIELSMTKNGQTALSVIKEINIKPYEVLKISFEITVPDETGTYLLKAETVFNGEKVFSLRDFTIEK
jgi:Beta-galactosidase/beta-glucuronidase